MSIFFQCVGKYRPQKSRKRNSTVHTIPVVHVTPCEESTDQSLEYVQSEKSQEIDTPKSTGKGMIEDESNKNYSLNNPVDRNQSQNRRPSPLKVPQIIEPDDTDCEDDKDVEAVVEKTDANSFFERETDLESHQSRSSVGNWTGLLPLEDALFPLLSWRTYDSTALSRPEEQCGGAPMKPLTSETNLNVASNGERQQSFSSVRSSPAAFYASRERLHYTQCKQPSCENNMVVSPRMSLPFIDVEAAVAMANKRQRKRQERTDLETSGHAVRCSGSKWCQPCACYRSSRKPSAAMINFPWIRRKPESPAAGCDRRRRHTHHGTNWTTPRSLRSGNGGSSICYKQQQSVSGEITPTRRLPRLHDLDSRLFPAATPAGDPSRDPNPEDFFQFLKLLGSGSYGKVHLARFRQTDERLAVKVQLTMQRRRAETELKVLMNIHPFPFIVALHSHFSTLLALYIVVEYVPNGTLTQKLKEPFSVVAAAFYSAQIALGLIHLHGRGILYRDLKPDNVLFTKDNNVKLCDFGSCVPGCNGLRKVKVSTGTPRYWAPEKLQQLPYGRPADWWSLGLIFYQMLMAKFPFCTAKHDYETYMDVVLHSEPQFDTKLAADAVSTCKAFLIKNPDKRLGGPDEERTVYDEPFYRRLIVWDAVLDMTTKPPPMYAHRYKSMPVYLP